jgi:hypothetical protein
MPTYCEPWPGEQERDPRRRTTTGRRVREQARSQLGRRARHDGRAVQEVRTPDRCGVADVRELVGRQALEHAGIAVDLSAERGVAARGHREHVRCDRRIGRRRRGRLLEHDMRVRAAHPHRHHRREARAIGARGERRGLRRDREVARVARERGVERVEALRRDLAVLEHERRLDEADRAGRRLEVADVRLDRAHRDRPIAAAEHRHRGLDLDRIAERRSRAVRL